MTFPYKFALSATVALGMLYAQNPPTVRTVPPNQTNPVSGKEMFMEYCAVCHGKDARGAGPAAAALKKTPANLTELAARNGGKFPDTRVSLYIQGSEEVSAHGSRDMPVWGTVFGSMQNNAAVTTMRIANLTDFIKSIQVKK